MRDNLQRSLDLVLAHEGGYVDHPKDPGGATNLGITIGTLSEHLGRPATRSDVRSITRFTADRIYTANYWDRARCNDLPLGLDYAVFDFAVNSGVSRAVRTLQRILGLKDDGVIGAKTMAAIKAGGTITLIEALCAERMKFLRGLKNWRTFGKGWKRRVMGDEDGVQDRDTGVIDRACRMALNMTVPPVPQDRDDWANAPAREEDQKLIVKGNDMLKGYKTYIVAAVTIIGAVASYLVGDADIGATAQLIVTAVLSATVRNGIAGK